MVYSTLEAMTKLIGFCVIHIITTFNFSAQFRETHTPLIKSLVALRLSNTVVYGIPYDTMQCMLAINAIRCTL